MMERPFVEIERPAWIEDKRVDRMMRIGRIEAVEDQLANVRLIVAIGILQIHHVRLLRDDHAAAVKLDSRGQIKLVGKYRLLVSFSVAVGVFKDQNLVV